MFSTLMLGSFRCFHAYKSQILIKTAAPLLLYFIACAAKPFITHSVERNPTTLLLTQLLLEIAMLMLAAFISIGVIRLTLLEENDASTLRITQREFKYFLYSLLILLIFIMPTALMSAAFILSFIFPGLIYLSLPGFVIALWCACRLSLIFPAIAVDQPITLKDSWKATRKHCWPLFVYTLLTVLILYAPTLLAKPVLKAVFPGVSGYLFDYLVYPIIDAITLLILSVGFAIYYLELSKKQKIA